MMKNIRGVVLASTLALGTCLMFLAAFHVGVAQAENGSGSGSGSSSIAQEVTETVTQAARPPFDPAANPAETLSMMSKLYHSGAFFALGIVLLFSLMYLLDEKVAWLREGKRGVYLAAAIGGIATCVGPATQGTTPNAAMIVTVLTTAVALIVNPKKPTSDEKSTTGTGTTTTAS